jgi:hypothetical protein
VFILYICLFCIFDIPYQKSPLLESLCKKVMLNQYVVMHIKLILMMVIVLVAAVVVILKSEFYLAVDITFH